MSQLLNHWRAAGKAASLGLAGMVGLGLGGCLTSGLGNRGTATTNHQAVQELFVGPGQLQYYLAPQQLAGPAGQYAYLDLVVRDSVRVLSHGLLHLSVVSPAALVAATDTLLLSTSGAVLPVAARLLYAEPKSKDIVSRLEAKLTPAQLTAYLLSPAKTVYVGGATGRRAFLPEAKALRNLQSFGARMDGADAPTPPVIQR